MNEFRNEEDALRRALDDAASHLPVPDAPLPVTLTDASRRRRSRRRTGVVLLAAAVAASLVVVTLVVALARDDSGRQVEIGTDSTQTVLAALAATVNSGGYDLDFTFRSEVGAAAAENACRPVPGATPGETQMVCTSTRPTDVSGHGTVNTNPYAMTVVSEVSGIGPVTLFVNGTTVWQLGGANYGTGGTFGAGTLKADGTSDAPAGASLSGFASLVESTIGPGQGALSMMSLANNSGYLGLEASAIESAVTDGEGALSDGTPVTYYSVTIDVTKMAEGEGLTDEQRQAISDAVAMLQSAGYAGTEERVGIDAAGFIREVTASTKFADGSSMTRHTVFSNFGCAARISMPNEAVPGGTAGTCPPVSAATTTVPTTSTTAPASSTSTTVAPTTTGAPVTLPPTTDPPTTGPPTTGPTTTVSSPAR